MAVIFFIYSQFRFFINNSCLGVSPFTRVSREKGASENSNLKQSYYFLEDDLF